MCVGGVRVVMGPGPTNSKADRRNGARQLAVPSGASHVMTNMCVSPLMDCNFMKKMIMGAGKTTVVGPLLAMLLANATTLMIEVQHALVCSLRQNLNALLCFAGRAPGIAGFLRRHFARALRGCDPQTRLHFLIRSI